MNIHINPAITASCAANSIAPKTNPFLPEFSSVLKLTFNPIAAIAVASKKLLPFLLKVKISSGSGKIETDRKSTRLNSSHDQISYAVFCLKKKKNKKKKKKKRNRQRLHA